MMYKLEALWKISAYIAENKVNSALEAEENMAVEANETQILEGDVILAIEPKSPDKNKEIKEYVNEQRFDCIYDDETLGFEKDPMAPEKMQPQEPLEEIDLG